MLEVEAVDLFYGAAQVLRKVSFTADPGQVTCVMGRNGVGKTSLMRAIVGLESIRNGEIMLADEPIRKLRPAERARRGIGFVPQGREIFPLLTVKENLETGYAPLARSEQTIPDEIFGLFPVLKDMLARRGGDLSGGQQQQLAIARALITRPRVLILDEPTEGIQPSIIKDIGMVIAGLRDRGDMMIVLVEQYFEFARDLADRFIVLDRGEVVAKGTRAEMNEADVRQHLTV
ncbi:MAG: urea ABC transporter ATP-binding subunit UrtE [Geminicoccaceae bacterium]